MIKKIYFLFLMLFFYENSVAQTQKKYSINIILKNNIEQIVYLYKVDKNYTIIDSVLVKNNTDSIYFNGTSFEEISLKIMFSKKGADLDIFVYNSDIQFNIDLDKSRTLYSIQKNLVMKDTLNELFKYYKENLKFSSNAKIIKDIKDKIEKISDKENYQKDSLIKVCDNKKIDICEDFIKFIYGSDSPVACATFLIYLREVSAKYGLDYADKIKYICNYLNERFYNSYLTETIKDISKNIIIFDEFKSIHKKMLGLGFSQITLPNEKNDSISLYVKGNKKYILLEFWASWCKPCREEVPNIKKAFLAYRNKGFDIYSVSIDRNMENWKKAIQSDSTNLWTQVIETKSYQNSLILQNYRITAIPSNFLISPEGKIIAVDLRGEALDKKLQEIFKK